MKRDRGWPGSMWKHRTDGFTAGGEQEVKGTSGLRCAGTTMFLSLYPLLTKDLSFSLFPFQEQRVNLWSSVPQDSVYARSLYVYVWKIQWHGLGHRNILSHRLQGGHEMGSYTVCLYLSNTLSPGNRYWQLSRRWKKKLFWPLEWSSMHSAMFQYWNLLGDFSFLLEAQHLKL